MVYGSLQVAGGGAVGGVFEDGLHCGAEALRGEFAFWDDDAGVLCCYAGGYSGLIVAERYGDERDALGEGFEDGVEAGVGDDGGGAAEELQLGGVADDDGVAG